MTDVYEPQLTLIYTMESDTKSPDIIHAEELLKKYLL